MSYGNDVKNALKKRTTSVNQEQYDQMRSWRQEGDTRSYGQAVAGASAAVSQRRAEARKRRDTAYEDDFLTRMDEMQRSRPQATYGTIGDIYSQRSQQSADFGVGLQEMRDYLEANREGFTRQQRQQWDRYLNQLHRWDQSEMGRYGALKDYYGQWETQEAYDEWEAEQAERERLLGLDIEQARGELARMEANRVANTRNISGTVYGDGGQMAGLDMTLDVGTRYGEGGTTAYREQMSPEEAKLRQDINRAEYLQNQAALWNVEQNADFARYSGYSPGTNLREEELLAWMDQNPVPEGDWEAEAAYYQYIADEQAAIRDMKQGRDLYEYINGTEEYRNQVDAPYRGYGTGNSKAGAGSEYYRKGYDLLNDKEVSIYNYYYAKEGPEKAQEYLDSIQEQLNQRKGQSLYEPLEGRTAAEIAFMVPAGLDQFRQGMAGLGDMLREDQGYRPASPVTYASGMVREDLADNGFQLPELLGGRSSAQAIYDAGTSIFNMAPSVLTSVAIGLLNPTAGMIAGNALMGASTAGNGYQEMLSLGYDKDQARAYGLLVGASEIGLGTLLGGISKLGGAVSGRAVSTLVDKVDNALARAAIRLGGQMGSEFTEEYLQTVLEPWYESITLGVENQGLELLDPEALYSGLLGALTAGAMEGPGAVTEGVRSYRADRTAKALEAAAPEVAAAENAAVPGEYTGELDPDEITEEAMAAALDGLDFSEEISGKMGEEFRSRDDYGKRDYVQGLKSTVEYARMGIPLETVKTTVYGSRLPEATRTQVWLNARQTEMKRAAAAQRKGSAGTGKVHFDRGNRSFDAVRETAISAMEQLSQLRGTEFYVFESYEKEGQRYYRDENGAEKLAPNGWYDPRDGSIHIDLNAGGDGRGTMLFTLGHELTHDIKQSSPKQYDTLKTVLLESFVKDGQDILEMIDSKKARESSLSDEGALDEVVADAMESMLTDGTVLEALAQIKKQDKSLWQKIVDFFKDFAGDLKKLVEAYQGRSAETNEGRLVQQMEEVRKQLQDIYTKALAEDAVASDGQMAAQARNEKTAPEGGIQYQLRAGAEEDVEKALTNTRYTEDVYLTESSPSIMVSQKGVRNLPMLMKASHIRENVFTEADARKLGLKVDGHIHYHGLGKELFLKVIDGLDEVTLAYRGTKNAENTSRRENYFILISKYKDANGNVINVPVYIEEKGQYNRVFVETNKIATVFGKSNFSEYINREIRKGNLVRIKNRSTQASELQTDNESSYSKNASIGSVPQKEEESKPQNQLREGTSNRELLTGALETVAQNEQERKRLEEYRGRIADIEKLESDLAEANKGIREMIQGNVPYDRKRMQELRTKATASANRIDIADRQLLRLEATAPVKAILERQRKAEQKKATQRVAEYRTRRNNQQQVTEEKGRIRKAIKNLERVSEGRDKKRNVKEELKDLVGTFAEDMDRLFTQHYGEEDMIRNGVGTDMSAREAAELDRARNLLEQLEDLRGTRTEQELQRRLNIRLRKLENVLNAERNRRGEQNLTAVELIKAGIQMKMTSEENRQYQEARRILNQMENPGQAQKEGLAKRETVEAELAKAKQNLRDVFERERNRRDDMKAAEAIQTLRKKYADLAASDSPFIQGAVSESSLEFLDNAIEVLGDTRMKDLSLEQLKTIRKAFEVVKHTISLADKLFNDRIRQGRVETSQAVEGEIRSNAKEIKWTPARILMESALWNNLKPVYAAAKVKSETFGKLMQGIFDGQYQWARNMEAGRLYQESLRKQYKSDSWDRKEKFDFTDSLGQAFSLDLEQMLSIYAYSRREQAHDHLLKGGFVFGKDGKMPSQDATAYKLGPEQLSAIFGKLTKEQMAWAEAMQQYLSRDMAELGNEVSRKLYGIKLFEEQNYFPLRSAGQYQARAEKADLEKNQGMINIVNSSFTKKTQPGANNPIVLDGFSDVWSSHVNEMSMYHAMVLPMEDFRRVWNYAGPNRENEGSVSVKASLQNAYGQAATQYFNQLYSQLNGGVVTDPTETLAKQMTAKFKKGAVMASLSVAAQQPSAVGRALSEINPKYFLGGILGNWEQLKQYAPVAIIKDMGGFDTHAGQSAQQYLMGDDNSLVGKIDQVTGWLPEKADQVTWLWIWSAVQREVRQESPGLKDAAFFQRCGERFSEVIEKTQVYDSVLSRSANMRSKSALMQMATSFMAEPTTTANMIQNALESGSRAAIARTLGAVAVSIVLNNALASLVYGARDDDEEETFAEKYAQSFWGGMLDDINPLGYYPFLRDIWSIFQGYEVERSDMAVVSDIKKAMDRVERILTADTGEMDEEALQEHRAEVWQALWGALDAGCTAMGIPLKNLRRDIGALWNVAETARRGNVTTELSLKDAIYEGILDVLPYGSGKTRERRLFDALTQGDSEYARRIREGYKSEESYHTAVRKALREFDPRITDAAKALAAGDYPGYEGLVAEILAEARFDREDVLRAIDAERDKLDPGEGEEESEQKIRGLYSVDDLENAMLAGNGEGADGIFRELVQTKMANGKSLLDATNAVEDSARGRVRELYWKGSLDRQRTQSYLQDYAGATEEEAKEYLREWQIYLDYGTFDTSASNTVHSLWLDGKMTDAVALKALVKYAGLDGEKAADKLYDWEVLKTYGTSWSDRGEAYKTGSLSRENLKKILIGGGYDSEEAELQIQAYDWQKKGLEEATPVRVRTYNEFCKAAGVPEQYFLEVSVYSANTENDVDENGKTISYSAVKKIMEKIHSLPLNAAQKDAVAKAMGWSDKTIRKYKLW